MRLTATAAAPAAMVRPKSDPISLRRLVWAGAMAVALAYFAGTLPLVFADALRDGVRNFSAPLKEIGWSPVVFALWFPAVQTAYVLLATSGAIVLVRRQPREYLSLLSGLVLVLFGTTGLNIRLSMIATIPFAVVLQAVQFTLLMVGANTLLLVFPDGRFYPRWSALILIPVTILSIMDSVIRLNFEVFGPTIWAINTITLMGLAVFGILVQLRRFRSMMTQLQRQQVKWVIAGMALVIGGMMLLVVFDPLIMRLLRTHPYTWLLYRLTFRVFLIYLPLSLAVVTLLTAVLKHRLWEVDFTVNRAAGVIVAIFGLAVVCVAVWVLLHERAIETEIVIFVLVLGVIGFNPTRRVIQRQIDRRFYGLRYPVEAYRKRTRGVPDALVGELSGQIIDGVNVHERIGHSTMSEVYKGVYMGEVVAFKVVRSNNDREIHQRFEREAHILASLDHPNILQMIGHGTGGGLDYIVTRYVKGETLKDMLDREGRLPLVTVRAIGRDIALALDYVHERGITHRDLKPSNILVSSRGWGQPPRATLMDFGFAKNGNNEITGTGTIGTIDYMAPEQIQASGAVGGAADVYALGVLLYEMLTGERPYSGNTGQILFAHLKQPAPDPLVLAPNLPPYIRPALMRALAKSPEDRFPTAIALIDAIEDSPTLQLAALRLV